LDLIYFGSVLYFMGDLYFVFHGGETQDEWASKGQSKGNPRNNKKY